MKKYAFTLIELLVVIVIIGILATIGVASFNDYMGKARDAKRVAQLRQVVTSFQTYAANDNTYPATSSGAICIGLNDSDTCWGGKINGDTSITNALSEHLNISGESTSLTGFGDYFAYLNGTIPKNACQSINNGNDGNIDATGTFILWQPEALTNSIWQGSAVCEGMGFASCCGDSGICNGGGYFCAFEIEPATETDL
jgi:prepilin-type N-terminal cleavage/methylation domain-containing protein